MHKENGRTGDEPITPELAALFTRALESRPSNAPFRGAGKPPESAEADEGLDPHDFHND